MFAKRLQRVDEDVDVEVDEDVQPQDEDGDEDPRGGGSPTHGSWRGGDPKGSSPLPLLLPWTDVSKTIPLNII
jgi:hypothetical protein